MDMGLNQNQFLSDQFMAFPPLPPVTGSHVASDQFMDLPPLPPVISSQVLSDQFMDLPPLPPVIGSQVLSDEFMVLPPLPPVTGSQVLSDPFMALHTLPPVTGSQVPSDQFMALPPLPHVIGSEDWLMSSHVSEIGFINNIGGGGVILSQDQEPYTSNPQVQLQHVDDPKNLQASLLGQLPASSSADLSMEFSQFLSSELGRQSTEMEAYLHLQNQSLNAEVETWKKLALEKEAKVTELSFKLKNVEERIHILNSGASDADSACGETSQDNSIMEVYGKCKVCQAQRSCVLLFPCRHLCCCKSCEATVKLCPICGSSKKESMEIFLA